MSQATSQDAVEVDLASENVNESCKNGKELKYYIPGGVPVSFFPKKAEFVNETKSKQAEELDKMDEKIQESSEKAYQTIASEIVDETKVHLKSLRTSKKDLRIKFSCYFRWLLGAQFVLLALIILCDSFGFWGFDITESVLHTYMISVFVETLSAIGMMIAFAFSTKEEENIIEVMTTVIQNYQKFK